MKNTFASISGMPYGTTKEEHRAYMCWWRTLNRTEYNKKRREWANTFRSRRNTQARTSHLKTSYGIDLDEYNAMLYVQQNKCAICGRPFSHIVDTKGRTRVNLCVDHDHTTGRVYGLLCHNCNVSIGLVANDAHTLIKAAQYVRGTRCNVDDKAVRARPMELAAIIQARMESTRLPGKVMMDIGGKPILAHVVERAKAAVENVIIATTPNSQAVIDWARANTVSYFVGDEDDVLDRYYQCALSYGVEHIVRLTADNPLVEPQMVKKLIRFYQDGGYDWAANCRLKITYPVGNDAEVFSFKALGRVWAIKTTDYDREHVTPYIYNHPELFKLGVMENDKDESDQRWTVDTLEDLERVREIYKESELCQTQG